MGYTKKQLVGLLLNMRRIRECEEALVEPINSGEVRTPCHLYSGQEAVAVGVLSAFTKKDAVFGTHRSHGHFLAKGGSMRGIMAEIFCRETGCARGRGGSMHLVAPELGMLGAAPIVGGTISLALGAALASHIRADKTVAAAFFGDGAVGEGAVYESLNFAALHKLPLLFVCENNLYATHMPLRACRNNDCIARIAEPFNIRTWRVDGNDVLAVRSAAEEAVKLCRAGKGPAFIECLTYRLRGHVGPDDAIQGIHTDIRSPSELSAWREKDPMIRFEKYLLAGRYASLKEIAAIKRRAQAEVADAMAFARRSVRPKADTLEKYVFK